MCYLDLVVLVNHRLQRTCAFQAVPGCGTTVVKSEENFHSTAAHYLASYLKSLYSLLGGFELPVLMSNLKEMVGMVLADPLTDSCICARSMGSCHPFAILLEV